MTGGGMRPGWYPDPSGKAATRWWDGYQWTPNAQGLNERDRTLRRIGGGAALVFAIVGAALAGFTNVSLLTGTSAVWTGVAIATIGGAAAWVVRPVHVSIKVVGTVLVALSITAGIYDEVQLQHRRDDLNHIFDSNSSNGKSLSHAAVEGFIQTKLGATVICNDGEDVPMHTAGQVFTCSGDGGRTFTVTITNPAKGDYVVR